MRARRLTCIFLFAVLFATARPARAQQTFAAGSLIIPMDVDYQNAGMFKAVGLLYQLLKAGVPVEWCIATGKTLYTGNTAFPTNAASAIDFTASATDTRTNAVITNHGYRGGPFVIDSSYRTQALPIITAWTTKYPQVAVHSATASFTATVSRNLINAPNIAINADGHEDIAFGYLNAAAIPDSKGQAWPTGTANSYPGYPDIMTPAQIAGPTTTNHHDGSLFDKNGLPVYCQVMSMHWDVGKRNEETIAEMASFFKYPTHLFAECQAVNCIEDATAGHFVSSDNLSGEPQSSVGCFNVPDNGLCAAQQPNQVSLFQSDLPFAQFDGAFATVGGSEPGYGLAPGSNYYNVGIVMMRSATASGFGQDDLWMTGVAGGLCAIGDHGNNCAGYGKVSYLGGHQYSTNLPMLQNPQSQGTRLFLQSLFEAGCTTLEGQPNLTITKSGPSTTYSALVTYDVNWNVAGPGAALNVIVTDTLPANATFVSASAPGVFANGKVTWALGDLAPRTSGQLTVTVSLPAHGAYTDVAGGVYSIGNSTDAVPGSSVTTVYQEAPDFAVPPDLAGSLCTNAMCTPPTNPCQTIACDPQTGACVTSNIADGTGCTTGDACVVGQSCTGGVCGGGVAVQCPTPTSACQTIACDHARGCVTTNVADGSACSSGDACVSGEVCSGGYCVGGMSVMCPASTNPCLAATCSPSSGCGFAAVPDGTACPSGSACVSGTVCTGGVCGGGTGIVCPPPSTKCTVVTCSPTNGCATAFAAAGTDPNADCPSAGACASTCNGAGACTVTCVGPGAACSSDAQCTTGHCADGVCCDLACTGACMACDLAGHVGTCTSVPDGQDPKGQCGAGAVCDGMGGCRELADLAVPPDLAGSLCMNVVCAQPANPCQVAACDPRTGSCVVSARSDGIACSSGDACTVGETCSGGVCGGGGPVTCPRPATSCEVAVCVSPMGCVTMPAAVGTDPDGDCPSQGACMNACAGPGACERACAGPGGGCGNDGDCSTGHCADGVCCATACAGPCLSCALAGTVGTCTPVLDGTDPGGQCGAGRVCDGMGGCRASGPPADGGILDGAAADLAPPADAARGPLPDLAPIATNDLARTLIDARAQVDSSGRGPESLGDLRAVAGDAGAGGGAGVSGCGCAVGAAPSKNHGAALAALLLLGIALRRRRR